MSERIVCVCGRVWLMHRFALTEMHEDEAICLCGQTLKRWRETADYVFEPVGAPVRMPLQIPHFLSEGFPQHNSAEAHRRATRGH